MNTEIYINKLELCLGVLYLVRYLRGCIPKFLDYLEEEKLKITILQSQMEIQNHLKVFII